jgi:hypothetical protein
MFREMGMQSWLEKAEAELKALWAARPLTDHDFLRTPECPFKRSYPLCKRKADRGLCDYLHRCPAKTNSGSPLFSLREPGSVGVAQPYFFSSMRIAWPSDMLSCE